jgi:DNA-binding SARP family transcriptional activator
MAVCVLGSTTVDGSARLSQRDRTVLSVLVANRGVSVSHDQLADALWGEQVPGSGRKIVQGVVVRLRKALGRTAIETTPGGYRLVLAGDEVDAWRFGDLVERARELMDLGELDRAVYTLDEALGLWRGDPLQELEGWPLAAGEIVRLQQLRWTAEERRLEALVSVGRHDDAAAAAGALVAAEPLRERRWELFALALYRSARQAEALRTIARARATLREELGIEPRAELAELEQAILNHDPELARPIGDPSEVSDRCPYKGLEAYDVGDAVSFFGRDAEVDACRHRLASAGFLVVTGASGSGKSSLVRAGLVPRLRAEGRAVALCVPGVDPPGAVAAALAVAGDDAVLVVDQLEELFTVCTDDDARERFADTITTHARRQLVVLVLRADHVAATAALPELRRMVEDSLYLLGQMTEPQLREAIEGPAREAGLRLEPGLVDVLVRDVLNEPGGLPLLSHALAETWARREGRVLTVAGYNDAGGVHGAVASTAERLYEELPDTQRATARSLFVRLVEMVDDGDPVRHRLARTVLDDEDQSARQVIDILLRARLVTASHDSLQIAHEALALAWPRLRAWLDEDREGQRILRHLTAAAQAWIARDRDPAELYRGSRLQTAENWADAHPDELNGSESAFLDASRAERDQQERTQRQTTRRIHRQLTAVSVLVVVALIAASLAVGLAVALAGRDPALDDGRESASETAVEPAGEVEVDGASGSRWFVLDLPGLTPHLAQDRITTRQPDGVLQMFRTDAGLSGPTVWVESAPFIEDHPGLDPLEAGVTEIEVQGIPAFTRVRGDSVTVTWPRHTADVSVTAIHMALEDVLTFAEGLRPRAEDEGVEATVLRQRLAEVSIDATWPIESEQANWFYQGSGRTYSLGSATGGAALLDLTVLNAMYGGGTLDPLSVDGHRGVIVESHDLDIVTAYWRPTDTAVAFVAAESRQDVIRALQALRPIDEGAWRDHMPDRPEPLHPSLEDLQTLYDAKAALVDLVDREFYEIARRRVEHGDDALSGAG